MRVPRLKFTIRLMMVAVAIAGVAFGGVELHRRRVEYLSQARGNGDLESQSADYAREGGVACESGRIGLTGEKLRKYDAERDASIAEVRVKAQTLAPYYRSLRLKYEYAARYPWLPVSPDPPEPE